MPETPPSGWPGVWLGRVWFPEAPFSTADSAGQLSPQSPARPLGLLCFLGGPGIRDGGLHKAIVDVAFLGPACLPYPLKASMSEQRQAPACSPPASLGGFAPKDRPQLLLCVLGSPSGTPLAPWLETCSRLSAARLSHASLYLQGCWCTAGANKQPLLSLVRALSLGLRPTWE